ncbi:MAG: CHAT domain-containing protein [Alkalinema sp. FL-bin-369]|nr:CHAT domain-containing protein [Leptolyngbyaceae cyanobacterium LF-bin-369]
MKNLAGTHLVVLSACETGRGGMTTEGMEVAGLGHFFLRSGAKSVMASLWLVNDPATALLNARLLYPTRHRKSHQSRSPPPNPTCLPQGRSHHRQF